MSQLTRVATHGSQQEYRPSVWAVLLHQVPHVNISFHRIIDDSFRPESEVYLESLGIIGSVPAAWLIFTLILLLIYLLTRCCDTKNNKKRKSRPVRCCLSFFSLLCIAALGAGFWGNHILHEETTKFTQATQHMSRLIQHAQNQAQKFNDVLSQHVRGNIETLYREQFLKVSPYQVQESHEELKNYSEGILRNITTGLESMRGVRSRLIDKEGNPITIGYIPKSVDGLESVRWPITMCLLGVCSVFCLLLFIGAIVHSRGTLILFSVCGLFSIIVLWLLAAVYITIAVAIADLCIDPRTWVERSLKNSYNLSQEISNYYLKCKPTSKSPFQEGLEDSQNAVMSIDSYVKNVNKVSRNIFSDSELNPELDQLVQASQQTLQIMGELNNSLKCDQLYRLYNDALVCACDQGLFGLLVMLVSAAICALVFTLLVWCNSHTWIYFKHKGKYVKVEDQDPYMPLSTIDRGRSSALGPPTYQRSRTIHTPPQTPPYHGTMNGHGHSNSSVKNGSLDPTVPPTLHAGVGYGHLGTLNRGMSIGAQGFLNPGHCTLGRDVKPLNPTGYSTYAGNPSAVGSTMTLGRRGHYASLRTSRGPETDLPLLGPNQGQYATLSKGCKTLESSDFY